MVVGKKAGNEPRSGKTGKGAPAKKKAPVTPAKRPASKAKQGQKKRRVSKQREKTQPSGQSTFRIEKIYLAQQGYRCVDFSDPTEIPKERELAISWDWRFRSAGHVEVKVGLNLGPSHEGREEIILVAIGGFAITSDLSKADFQGFVKVSAPAILFPYLREAVTSLTSKGPFAPVLLHPMNIATLVSEFDPEKATGWGQLEKDETLLCKVESD